MKAATATSPEEARHWEQNDEADILQQPQYGMTGEEFENVWDREGEP